MRQQRAIERLLLRLLPPGAVGQSIVGDLREEFKDRTGAITQLRYVAAATGLAIRYGGARIRSALQRAFRPSSTSYLSQPVGRSALAVAGSDVADAWRGLRRHKVFTITGMGLLALGLAASSIVFSFVNAVLLRPIPHIRDLDRVVRIQERVSNAATNALALHNVTSGDMRRIDEVVPSIEATAAMLTGGSIPYFSEGGTQRIPSATITHGFFKVVGAEPTYGRAFSAADEAEGAAPVVVLSYGAWQRMFGGAPDAIGSLLKLNDKSYQVVGVMPEGFTYPDGPSVYLPMLANPFTDRFHVATGIARLRAGASLERAELEVSAAIASLARDEPDLDHGAAARVIPWRDALTMDVRPALRILSLAAALVLLLAAVNLGGLLVSRAAERQRELAVRQSLGATRGRVVRLLLAEGLVLGIGGAVLGGALAAALLKGVVVLSPADLPFRDGVRMDWITLAFTAFLAVIAGLAAGAVPALFTDTSAGLRNRSGASPSSTRVGRGFVVAQLAGATVLMTSAAVLVRSFSNALHVNPGVRIEGVLSAGISLPRRYGDAREMTFYRSLVDSLRAIPNVTGAELGMFSPLRGSMPMEGAIDSRASKPERLRILPVSAGYLSLMGAKLLDGRWLEPRLDARTAERVAIIGRSGASRLWPGASALDHVVYLNDTSYRIVGVVEDIKHERLMKEEATSPVLYVHRELFPVGAASLVIVTRGDPAVIVPRVREIVKAIDPTVPIDRVEALASLLREDVAQPRFFSVTVGAFGVLALALAIIGLYAVIAFAVRARLFEFGIRAALGAAPVDTLWLVFRQGMVLCAAGVGVGVILSYQATRILRSVLFHTQPTDALAFASAGAIVFAAGLVAILTPAIRASRTHPMVALRSG